MALGATIYKVDISLSNLNTHYYQDFNLTIAKHPSENESRMMYRLLAFLYCAHEDLTFCKGISNNEEPDLWQKDYSGEIIQWIDLGLPDIKRVRQASGKSKSVSIFTYHQSKVPEWYQKNTLDFSKINKIDFFHLLVIKKGPIDIFITKSMKLSCLIEEQLMYLSDDNERIEIEVQKMD
jgi:uncharacterized protein YaeQ